MGKEAVTMNNIVKRERGTFADLFDWLENEFPAMPVFRPFAGQQMMRVEDYEEAGQYILRAELPGIDPEKDVDIAIENGVLTVKAERREEKTTAHRSEFRYGTLMRRLTLPPGADEEDVQATYRDGILEVRIAVKEQQRPTTKHISIAKG